MCNLFVFSFIGKLVFQLYIIWLLSSNVTEYFVLSPTCCQICVLADLSDYVIVSA